MRLGTAKTHCWITRHDQKRMRGIFGHDPGTSLCLQVGCVGLSGAELNGFDPFMHQRNHCSQSCNHDFNHVIMIVNHVIMIAIRRWSSFRHDRGASSCLQVRCVGLSGAGLHGFDPFMHHGNRVIMIAIKHNHKIMIAIKCNQAGVRRCRKAAQKIRRSRGPSIRFRVETEREAK